VVDVKIPGEPSTKRFYSGKSLTIRSSSVSSSSNDSSSDELGFMEELLKDEFEDVSETFFIQKFLPNETPLYELVDDLNSTEINKIDDNVSEDELKMLLHDEPLLSKPKEKERAKPRIQIRLESSTAKVTKRTVGPTNSPHSTRDRST
jgi:hypothetical protein